MLMLEVIAKVNYYTYWTNYVYRSKLIELNLC